MKPTNNPVEPGLVEQPAEREAVYQPPMLVEVGLFAEVTRGAGGGPYDFLANVRGYWLI